MRNILSRAGREALEEFAWSNVLLGFDFDGTLAPIVPRPDQAVMRPATLTLFRRVIALYPSVVISGRAREDVARRLPGKGLLSILGNHGIEPWQATPDVIETIRRFRPVLDRRVAAFPGVLIEDKTYSLTAHFRRSRTKRAARAAIVAAATDVDGLRVVGGKQVVNILPAGPAHKGTALERERTRAGCDTAIFLGDDDTDEDVFGL
ncbi:MAG TPA: trehalose-phosphatase, partial [Gemmatimonadales bacterium]|nr:trehalose-phosphatase [Gemmatimonadales bacterium]